MIGHGACEGVFTPPQMNGGRTCSGFPSPDRSIAPPGRGVNLAGDRRICDVVSELGGGPWRV